MPTGMEIETHRNIERIARAAERIAEALESIDGLLRTEVRPAPIWRLHPDEEVPLEERGNVDRNPHGDFS